MSKDLIQPKSFVWIEFSIYDVVTVYTDHIVHFESKQGCNINQFEQIFGISLRAHSHRSPDAMQHWAMVSASGNMWYYTEILTIYAPSAAMLCRPMPSWPKVHHSITAGPGRRSCSRFLWAVFPTGLALQDRQTLTMLYVRSLDFQRLRRITMWSWTLGKISSERLSWVGWGWHIS